MTFEILTDKVYEYVNMNEKTELTKRHLFQFHNINEYVVIACWSGSIRNQTKSEMIIRMLSRRVMKSGRMLLFIFHCCPKILDLITLCCPSINSRIIYNSSIFSSYNWLTNSSFLFGLR